MIKLGSAEEHGALVAVLYLAMDVTVAVLGD
jgi:hypothetical protein